MLFALKVVVVVDFVGSDVTDDDGVAAAAAAVNVVDDVSHDDVHDAVKMLVDLLNAEPFQRLSLKYIHLDHNFVPKM